MTPRPASRATVKSVTQGDAPFRNEVQAFSCDATAAGVLLVSWRGLGNVTVHADDDLNVFESAISAGLTNVTVTGTSASRVCSNELVYVTFEEVSSLPTMIQCPGTKFDAFRLLLILERPTLPVHHEFVANAMVVDDNLVVHRARRP